MIVSPQWSFPTTYYPNRRVVAHLLGFARRGAPHPVQSFRVAIVVNVVVSHVEISPSEKLLLLFDRSIVVLLLVALASGCVAVEKSAVIVKEKGEFFYGELKTRLIDKINTTYRIGDIVGQ